MLNLALGKDRLEVFEFSLGEFVAKELQHRQVCELGNLRRYAEFRFAGLLSCLCGGVLFDGTFDFLTRHYGWHGAVERLGNCT